MTPEQLAELKDNATLRKRLAKKMAHDCFRNTTKLEAMHTGKSFGSANRNPQSTVEAGRDAGRAWSSIKPKWAFDASIGESAYGKEAIAHARRVLSWEPS
jgi:hypothetical protein